MNWHAWHWNDSITTSPAPNNTFLGLDFHLGWESTRYTRITETQSPLNATVTTQFGAANMTFTIDLGYLLDDIPIISQVRQGNYDVFMDNGTQGLSVLGFTTTFCEPFIVANTPLTRWHSYYYDPSLVAVFGEAPSKTSPSNSKAKSTRSYRGLYIGFPVAIGILLITAILVIALVPSLRAKFIPSYADTSRELTVS